MNYTFIKDDPNPEALGQVKTIYAEFVNKLAKVFPDRRLELCHAGLGICGEAGELADAIKKEAIYGKPEDRTNIVEELGDLCWYIQYVQLLYGITDAEIFEHNYSKLGKRYEGLNFTDAAAIARADKIEVKSEDTIPNKPLPILTVERSGYVVCKSSEHFINKDFVAGPFDTTVEALNVITSLVEGGNEEAAGYMVYYTMISAE